MTGEHPDLYCFITASKKQSTPRCFVEFRMFVWTRPQTGRSPRNNKLADYHLETIMKQCKSGCVPNITLDDATPIHFSSKLKWRQFDILAFVMVNIINFQLEVQHAYVVILDSCVFGIIINN